MKPCWAGELGTVDQWITADHSGLCRPNSINFTDSISIGDNDDTVMMMVVVY